MFARIKKSGKYQYLQIVANRKVKSKVKQTVIATIGRLDQLQQKDRMEILIRSLSRYSEKVLLILSQRSNLTVQGKKIGPALIFERLWRETGVEAAIKRHLVHCQFEFDVERAIFLTVLHRLMVSGSDRSGITWSQGHRIRGIEGLSLHHLYRAMAFLGEELTDQAGAPPFSPRCVKDLIEEDLFFARRTLFSSLNLVFFDTTSLYFEGAGGRTLGRRGNNKDGHPDLKQMVVAAVLDNQGVPLCCELWPGNTTDVKTLIPIADRLRKRFHLTDVCLVADRGMISKATLTTLEAPDNVQPYILGVRMRKVKEIREKVLSDPNPLAVVVDEGDAAHDPAPLQVKEVKVNDRRYIVCFNPKQARKDAADREAILASLREHLLKGARQLVGNKGYRKYLSIKPGSVTVDEAKVTAEARYDGTWVLTTNIDLSAAETALRYKDLWMIERFFREFKSGIGTRPVYHKVDETIRGHVFCSFLALVIRKELERRLTAAGHQFEWDDIKRDLAALQEFRISESGTTFAVRSECEGTCGKIFQAVRVSIPATIRVVESGHDSPQRAPEGLASNQ